MSLTKLHHRVKGKGTGPAFVLGRDHEEWLQLNPRVKAAIGMQVVNVFDSNGDLIHRYLTIRRDDEGYEINYKKPGARGEISVAYNVLNVRPAGGKLKSGNLLCFEGLTDSGKHALCVDITAWEYIERPEVGLFDNVIQDGPYLLGKRGAFHAVPNSDPVTKIARD